ncbi:unnamed protein product [Alopecurus aequalis]
MAAASSLLLLLLLLVAPPFSLAAFRPSPRTNKYVAQAVRSIIKNTAKDYLKDKVNDGVQDVAGGSNNVDGRELGSSAAASYGALTFELSVGNPPQSLSVVMDITSEIVWAQCDDPCLGCVRQTPPGTPTFLSDNSASFAKILCNDPSCQSVIPDDCSAIGDLCGYTEEFFRSGKTSGYLANEKFSFGTTVFPDMLFGCGNEIILPELGGASGFAGFSRGPLSLVSQLQISEFSYLIALPDDSGNSKSSLSWSWDDDALTPKGSGSTPLLVPTAKQNPYWYYVRLTGLEVDGQPLTDIPAGTFDVGPDGSGGVFLSTTLPVTYLEEAGYNVLRSELISRIKAQGVDPTNAADDIYHLCYSTLEFVDAKVPTLALVFDGSDAVMELSVENYFFRLADGQTCLTILPSNGGSVLGSLLQVDTTMTYHINADGTGMLTFETAAAATAAGASPTAKAHRPLVVVIISSLLAAWGLSL